VAVSGAGRRMVVIQAVTVAPITKFILAKSGEAIRQI
jgi:hypothetical protein